MDAVRHVYMENQVLRFLHYILDHTASRILLIICSDRNDFLRRLLVATVRTRSNETSDRQLVTKTLGLLSKSSRIQVVFCPTLEHLRAYLSVLHLNTGQGSDTAVPEQQICRPLMAILDPLALHLPTSEFSAQGLSRTLAAVVETSSREAVDLVLCECQHAARSNSGEALWNAYVPMLNSSVRTGRDESTFGGRSIPVKRIARRWFAFSDPRISTTNSQGV